MKVEMVYAAQRETKHLHERIKAVISLATASGADAEEALQGGRHLGLRQHISLCCCCIYRRRDPAACELRGTWQVGDMLGMNRVCNIKLMQTLGTKPVSVPLPLSSALKSSERSSCSAALCRYTSSCVDGVECQLDLGLWPAQAKAEPQRSSSCSRQG